MTWLIKVLQNLATILLRTQQSLGWWIGCGLDLLWNQYRKWQDWLLFSNPISFAKMTWRILTLKKKQYSWTSISQGQAHKRVQMWMHGARSMYESRFLMDVLIQMRKTFPNLTCQDYGFSQLLELLKVPCQTPPLNHFTILLSNNGGSPTKIKRLKEFMTRYTHLMYWNSKPASWARLWSRTCRGFFDVLVWFNTFGKLWNCIFIAYLSVFWESVKVDARQAKIRSLLSYHIHSKGIST